ncbi:hypothetical protein HDU98_002371 [Podochytrium sp. JEL0797]|nr:hypothetical protein HDU98_002371 [Podochytrium sp. JEL0797]
MLPAPDEHEENILPQAPKDRTTLGTTATTFTPSPASSQPTYIGFVQTQLDASLLVEAEVEPNTPIPQDHPIQPNLSTRFINISIRGDTRFIPNGLAKRAINVTGSNGLQYRVVNYFYPAHVEQFFRDARAEVVQQALAMSNSVAPLTCCWNSKKTTKQRVDFNRVKSP